MDNLQSLLQKVNKKTKDKPIFFACNDPERALGLETLLDNYHIVCIDDNEIVNYMKNSNVKIFCLEKELGKLNAIFRNSNRLLQHDLTKKHIKKISNSGYFMFFKIAPNLERTSEDYGFDILNTSSKLNRKFELKLSQYEAVKDIDIRLPKTKIVKLKDADFEEVIKNISQKFVAQFNRGHTGKGTTVISNKYQLEELKEKFPKRKVRISQFIKGKAYTLNACVTRKGICWGGLSFQITGVEECTNDKSATVGNDWVYPKNLDKKVVEEIDRFTSEIGKRMFDDGFLGMFGVDLVIEEKTNKPFIIEINARQPASIPMFTKLQVQNDQIPLKLLSIAEFLDIDYDIDLNEYNQKATKPIGGSQLFFRNNFSSKTKVIGGIKPGVYRLVGDNTAYDWSNGSPDLKKNVIMIDEEKDKPLIYKKRAFSVDGYKEGGMLILCSKEGKIITKSSEVARIQTKHTLLNDEGTLKTWVKEVAKGLNKYIILRKLSRNEIENTKKS